ncbi:hypothetical protein IAT40_004912 [Kwoniella sp. CBS 6097]
MDSDNKHEHMPSPQGPEDASNIADEYPSPEREAPPTLHDHQEEQQQDERGHIDRQDGTDTGPHEHESHQDQDHPHEREEIDMQTEFANQVAAQAIEAAVAAEAQANANASSSVNHTGNGSAQSGVAAENNAEASSSSIGNQPTQQPQDTLANHHDEHADHMQSHTIRSQHHPRQPTFPRARSALSFPAPSPSHPNILTQPHARGGSTPTELPQNEQIAILREAYAKNPNPGKKELESLAERTGRPWNKIREYFRQRRNKLRGLEDLENMEEPGRATGWLQVAYRAGPPNSHVTQLSVYNSYKHRFDPYSITTPLLGGQELIQLACATFPGCEMAKDEGDYVLKGLKEKEKEPENERDEEEWEKGMEGLVEPLRAGSWLLSSFQHQSDPNTPSTLTQTDLYTSYAARFSTLLTNAGGLSIQDQDENNGAGNASQPTAEEVRAAQDQAAELKAFEDAGLGGSGANDDEPETGVEQSNDDRQQDGQDVHMGSGVTDNQSFAQLALLPEPVPVPGQHDHPVSLSPNSSSPAPQPPLGASASTSTPTPVPAHVARRENRLLNPFELINLTRMTFPKCEPSVDASGRFIIRGLTRREGHEPGARNREREMFPFALMSEAKPGDAFVGLMKRKLEMLNPEPGPESQRNQPHGSSAGTAGLTLTPNGDGHGPNKRARMNEGGLNENNGNGEQDLTEEDRELVEGLKRFRGSKLGEQVRDACVSQ